MHPLDFLGCDDVKELAFFPAMDLTSEKKIKVISDVIDIYTDHYEVVPIRQHVQSFFGGERFISDQIQISFYLEMLPVNITTAPTQHVELGLLLLWFLLIEFRVHAGV